MIFLSRAAIIRSRSRSLWLQILIDVRLPLSRKTPGRKGESLVRMNLWCMDQLSEKMNWGLTPKGLVVYFDFPHAIAVFDRTVVPYNVINEYLKPNSPAAQFHNL